MADRPGAVNTFLPGAVLRFRTRSRGAGAGAAGPSRQGGMVAMEAAEPRGSRSWPHDGKPGDGGSRDARRTLVVTVLASLAASAAVFLVV